MRLVIIGCGYSGAAIAREIGPIESLIVTGRRAEKVAALRAAGFETLAFDGTSLPEALGHALQRATHLLVCAPPDEAGDPLLRAGKEAVLAAPHLEACAYLSTVGVYGDHGGAWVDEEAPLRPVSARSRQRVAAESAWQDVAARRGVPLGIFRLSGIYGPGRSAIDNLRAGTVRRIVKPGQVFNRIHVADIAGAVTAGLLAPEQLGIFNLTDDEPAPPQDVVAYAAALMGMSAPPEIPFDAAPLSPMGRSFYGENKRVANTRIKAALGYRFRFPSYREGLKGLLASGQPA